MNPEAIQISYEGPFAILTINRPEALNALNKYRRLQYQRSHHHREWT
jgi:enoyl-CoA hydratase/carnithine racemase